MSKPVQLCKLTAGKALAAFPNFVATFNWLVDFCSNLRGEGEDESGNPDNKITVDRSNDSAPVLRGGAGGGGMNLIKGDDTNIVFTEVTEGDDAGKYKVDVYYV